MSVSMSLVPKSMPIPPRIIEKATLLYNALQVGSFHHTEKKMQQLFEDYKIFNPENAESLNKIFEEYRKNPYEKVLLDGGAVQTSSEKCTQQMMKVLLKDVPDLQNCLDRQERFTKACLERDYTKALHIFNEGPIDIKACKSNRVGELLIPHAFFYNHDLLEFILINGKLNIKDIEESFAQVRFLHGTNWNDFISGFIMKPHYIFVMDPQWKEHLLKFLPLFIGIGFDINLEWQTIQNEKHIKKTVLGEAVAYYSIDIIRVLVFHGARMSDEAKFTDRQAKKIAAAINVHNTILFEMHKGKNPLTNVGLPSDVLKKVVTRCQRRMEFLDLLNFTSIFLDMLILSASGNVKKHNLDFAGLREQLFLTPLENTKCYSDMRSLVQNTNEGGQFREEYDRIVGQLGRCFPEAYKDVQRHMEFMELCQLGDLVKAQQVLEEGNKEGFFDVNICMVLRRGQDLKHNGYLRHPLLNHAADTVDDVLVDFLLKSGADANVVCPPILHFGLNCPPAIIAAAFAETTIDIASLQAEAFLDKQERVFTRLLQAKADVNLCWKKDTWIEIYRKYSKFFSGKAMRNLVKCGWNIENQGGHFLNREFVKCDNDPPQKTEMIRQIVYLGGLILKDDLPAASLAVKAAVSRRFEILKGMVPDELPLALPLALPRLSLDLVNIVYTYLLHPEEIFLPSTTEKRLELSRRCNEGEKKEMKAEESSHF